MKLFWLSQCTHKLVSRDTSFRSCSVLLWSSSFPRATSTWWSPLWIDYVLLNLRCRATVRQIRMLHHRTQRRQPDCPPQAPRNYQLIFNMSQYHLLLLSPELVCMHNLSARSMIKNPHLVSCSFSLRFDGLTMVLIIPLLDKTWNISSLLVHLPPVPVFATYLSLKIDENESYWGFIASEQVFTLCLTIIIAVGFWLPFRPSLRRPIDIDVPRIPIAICLYEPLCSNLFDTKNLDPFTSKLSHYHCLRVRLGCAFFCHRRPGLLSVLRPCAVSVYQALAFNAQMADFVLFALKFRNDTHIFLPRATKISSLMLSNRSVPCLWI